MADKYELKVGVTRVQITRADGSTLEVEAGEQRDPRNDEDEQLLKLHPDIKVAEKGGKS